MVSIVRLRTRQQRSDREMTAEAAEQLGKLPLDVLQQLSGGIKLAISRATYGLQKHARPDNEEGLWPGGFTMLSRIQTAAVWDAIRALKAKDRPNQVRHAFDLILLNLRHDTGEVMLTRDQFADAINTKADNISRIMGTLERLDVIRRERRAIEGVRGRGIAVYFLNPHVAWNGHLDVRKEEAAGISPPLLTLMQGGVE